MPMNYNASAITDNKTLLEKLHEIEKHLEENPLYKVYYATTSYMVGTTTYDKSFLLAKDQDTIGEGDVVFFNNKYYALVLSANDKQFFTAPAISLGEEGGTESKQITELEFTNVLNLFFDNIDGAKINYYGKTKYADGTETPNAMELQIPIKAGDDIIIDATEDNEHIEVKVDTTSLFVKLPSQALDIYPIGSIYTSVESTSPAELFGGTWTQLSSIGENEITSTKMNETTITSPSSITWAAGSGTVNNANIKIRYNDDKTIISCSGRVGVTPSSTLDGSLRLSFPFASGLNTSLPCCGYYYNSSGARESVYCAIQAEKIVLYNNASLVNMPTGSMQYLCFNFTYFAKTDNGTIHYRWKRTA